MWQVLVVDDEKDIREGLADVLRARGYRALTASDGQHALAMLRDGTAQPALVLLDLEMPHLDGAGFLATQAEEPRMARVPVVVVTAHGERRVSSPMVRAVFSKPLDLRRLLGVVRDVCTTS